MSLSPEEGRQVAAFADSSAFLFPTSLDTPVSFRALTAIEGRFFFFNSSEFPAQTDGSLAPMSLNIAPIPLPATVSLLASGLAAFGLFAFRHGGGCVSRLRGQALQVRLRRGEVADVLPDPRGLRGVAAS